MEFELRISDSRVLVHFCELYEEGTVHEQETGVMPTLSLGLALC